MAGRDLRGHLNHTSSASPTGHNWARREASSMSISDQGVNFSRTKISTHKFLTTCLRISNQVLMLKLLTESGSNLYMASHFTCPGPRFQQTNEPNEASMDQNQANCVRWRQRSQEENQCGYVYNDAKPTMLQKHQIQEIAVHRGLQQKSRLYTIHTEY